MVLEDEHGENHDESDDEEGNVDFFPVGWLLIHSLKFTAIFFTTKAQRFFLLVLEKVMKFFELFRFSYLNFLFDTLVTEVSSLEGGYLEHIRCEIIINY